MLEPLEPNTPPRVGPYQLLARLGAGGMGQVCLARPADGPHPAPEDGGGLSGYAAVKTVRRDLDLDREFRLRFAREAAAAHAVRSRYTAALLAAEPEAEQPWLATEYVPGPSLHEALVRCGPLAPETVRALGTDLARALLAVHGARVLHRDLKPANVLLGTDGPKLIDFGIALAFDATALTATGLVIGTPGFMSPEHVADAAALGPASDIFCLGSLLCFAATGRSPFEDPELAAVLHRIAQGDADLSGLPEELHETVAGCLRPDPAARPTADRLIAVLGAGRAEDEPFPWPPGVRELIGEYEGQVRAYAAAAPVLPPLPPAPPAYVPPEDAPPPPRRRLGPRVAVSAVIGTVAGALVALLLPQLGIGDGSGASDKPSASPSHAAVAAGGPAPMVFDDGELGGSQVEFGAAARNPKLRPKGWKPWRNRTVAKPVQGCALLPKALVCTTDAGTESHRLTDGKLLWRYPDEPRQPSPQEQFPSIPPAVSGDRVYTKSHDGSLVALRTRDGAQLSSRPAVQGFPLVRAIADHGVVYAAYSGPAGENTSSSMLFRAYREKDGRKLWETNEHGVFPKTMTLVRGRLELQGMTTAAVLDAKTGRRVAKGSPCVPFQLFKESLLCPRTGSGASEVRDGKTLRVTRRLPLEVAAVGNQGIALGKEPAAGIGRPAERGVRAGTGKVLWNRDVPGTSALPAMPYALMGDEYLAIGGDGVQRFALATGRPRGVKVKYPGWPRRDAGKTLALVRGGVVYLLYGDGQIVSGALP